MAVIPATDKVDRLIDRSTDQSNQFLLSLGINYCHNLITI